MGIKDPKLPGAPYAHEAYTESLFEYAKTQRDAYEVRTHHRKNGEPIFVNRLVEESSPYLLQHAHNPVNWFPWADEAFERAKRSKKPILLSVGYATCHWCHVMEEESFEDLEIAEYINQNFIAIKVDREERPDIDAVYMTAVQMLTGRGGWPMTVVMTPEQKPFFGGTYFPARDGDRGIRVGFLSILKQLSESFKNEKDEVLASAAKISKGVAERNAQPPGTGLIDQNAADELRIVLRDRMFDPRYGGYGRAPKFPQPSKLLFMLRAGSAAKDQGALDGVYLTLHKMADGGIHDQVGGGFHRYSTDVRWLIPHFEKMLYDNAQLVVAYLQASQITENEEDKTRFVDVAKRTLDYALKEMRHESGLFYSATDADSEKPNGEREEGYFFTWSPTEIKEAAGEKGLKIAQTFYGVTERGNFEHKNILERVMTKAQAAGALGMSIEAFESALADLHRALYDTRKQTRKAPLLDDKALAAWNGLMLTALSRGARILQDPRYHEAAQKQFVAIKKHFVLDGKKLLRVFRNSKSKQDAFLEDYALIVAGLLDYFEASADGDVLSLAIALQGTLDQEFRSKDGAYFATGEQQEALIAREVPLDDSALPSGNSVTYANLLRLSAWTSNADYDESLDGLVRAGASQYSLAQPAFIAAYLGHTARRAEIIVIETENSEHEMTTLLANSFLPNAVVVTLNATQSEKLAKIYPVFAGKTTLDGKDTAFVCERGQCQLPVHNARGLRKQLKQAGQW